MTLRVAVAHFTTSGDIPDQRYLREVGDRVRSAITQAAGEGARLVVFPEGTLGYPHKRKISRSAPELDEADWSRVDWESLRQELRAVGEAAREAGTWVVVGAPHWRGEGLRPHNSLFVFSDLGELVTRYDKQRLSMTEVSYLYAPGIEPVTFEVHGYRVGLALCLEALFPDLFIDYADRGCDLVLVASAGGGIFGQLVLAYSAITWMSIALAIPPSSDDPSPSGVCGPFGWVAETRAAEDDLVVADVARRSAMPFHFEARHGLYDAHLQPDHPRTVDRTSI